MKNKTLENIITYNVVIVVPLLSMLIVHLWLQANAKIVPYLDQHINRYEKAITDMTENFTLTQTFHGCILLIVMLMCVISTIIIVFGPKSQEDVEV